MLGSRIASLRHKAKLSQKKLAERLHISPSAVGMYEQGRREPSIDILIYDVNAYQLKESIVIHEHDTSLRGYVYVLETGTLTPFLNADGSIDLKEASTNEIIMTMPAPFMIDNSGAINNDVTVTLERKGNSYVLAYQIPTEWLADNNRSWPVVLDPAVIAYSHYSNIQDQYVAEDETVSYKIGVLKCGYSSSDGIMHTYIQYVNLPNITSADIVVHASLSLLSYEGTSGTTLIEAHKVEEMWNSQTITWDNQPAYDNTIEDFAQVGLSERYTWNITDIVRNWYADKNTGVMLKAADNIEGGTNSNWKKFYSIDYDKNSPEIWPYLTITYRNANGLESYWDYSSASAGRAGTGYVNNYTGNLTWVHNDIGFSGNRMPVSISHIYNTNDSAVNSFGLGYGWKTNYHQFVEPVVVSENEALAITASYVWTDGDGTKHYFVANSNGVLVDEDGLNLTLSVSSDGYSLVDQDGNERLFDTKGRLTMINNNQTTKSSISIYYQDGSSKLITLITDGAGRKYRFSYNDNNMLSKIAYTGDGETEISSVTFSYNGYDLKEITYKDGTKSTFTYDSKHFLISATDVDGYKIQYSYCPTEPHRVTKITEYDGASAGGSLSIEYAHNQTTLTDHNGNAQVLQFNDWGNVVAVQDNQGRAQFAQYAFNKYDDKAEDDQTLKGNQLRLSSKMQNTVVNLQRDSSFESNNPWTVISSAVSRTRTSSTAYVGKMSLKMTRSAAGSASGVYATAINVPAGKSCTFSAYVKTGSSANAYLAFVSNGTVVATSETLTGVTTWTRLQVNYTNTSTTTVSLTPQFLTTTSGSVYMDGVQIEMLPTASRLNLIENGDFAQANRWSPITGRTTAPDGPDQDNLPDVATPQTNSYVYQFVGNPTAAQSISQTVQVSGAAGDAFVLSGWALADSAPLTQTNRAFALNGVFHYTDGTQSAPFVVGFNPDMDSSNWQYAAGAIVAGKAYDSITVTIDYSNNVNTAYFDGIQLFREEFGSTYTYNTKGNVTNVKDLQNQITTYVYDDNSNDLLKIQQNEQAQITYTYDGHHNVKTATTAEGVVYEFTYDNWGNNTAVSIVNGSSRITSTATYSSDGNYLVSTKDALDKTTYYSYNKNTGVLEWVKYPNDTDTTKTTYSYDSMYRLAASAVNLGNGSSLSASYTYTDDQLTKITTPKTTYTLNYGYFGTISSIKAGARTLATYGYTSDGNWYLDELTYGNGDFICYYYDDYGRVVKESYEDALSVVYQYDNNGALATVIDVATGTKTTYYYDFIDRLVKYVETGSNYSHSVSYVYDVENKLTSQSEVIDGVAHSTAYTYDDDDRIVTVTYNGSSSVTYAYDAYGRVTQRLKKAGSSTVLTENITYKSNSTQVASVTSTAASYSTGFTYNYDGNGNITSVTNGGKTTTYVYDAANQLIRENNQAAGKTWAWTYDDAGNILTKKEYAYTTGTVGTVLDTIDYTYGSSEWKDLLTKYDGVTITYDHIGNPLSDGT